jgi:hypothetical protein
MANGVLCDSWGFFVFVFVLQTWFNVFSFCLKFSFFVLIIIFLMSSNMSLWRSESVVDKYRWRCGKGKWGEQCNTTRSLRHFSWFTKSKLTLMEIMLLTYDILQKVLSEAIVAVWVWIFLAHTHTTHAHATLLSRVYTLTLGRLLLASTRVHTQTHCDLGVKESMAELHGDRRIDEKWRWWLPKGALVTPQGW